MHYLYIIYTLCEYKVLLNKIIYIILDKEKTKKEKKKFGQCLSIKILDKGIIYTSWSNILCASGF